MQKSMKQDYVKMRNTGKYNINWFYKYFVENGGKRIDINLFSQLFNMIDSSEVLRFLDVKFNLTKLEDSEGNLIKIVE
jgi:hypothetical protein